MSEQQRQMTATTAPTTATAKKNGDPYMATLIRRERHRCGKGEPRRT
jgi:hypothetical protein